jgi:uncharacterized protein YegJ (DUF2314 family)
MTDSPIFTMPGDDPEMVAASRRARQTFKYMWRELSWEYRRIVPGLDVAAVKVSFANENPDNGGPECEHMWLSEIQCDGRRITGTLLNEPEWVTSVAQGDSVAIKLDELGDWMYAVYGKVYGAYTVNLMRSRMGKAERKAHDEAWGLDFGDPADIQVVPDWSTKPGLISKLFGKKSAPVDPDGEHPMSLNMGDSLREQCAQDSEFASAAADDGWTWLHRDALAGNLTSVQVLLENGADPQQKTNDGRTAKDLAEVFQWKPILDLLAKHGS